MKVTSDLRAAIKAAEETQIGATMNYRDREKAAAVAIQELCKKRLKLKTAILKYQQAHEAISKAQKVFDAFGVDSDGNSVRNAILFKKHGGDLTIPEQWKANRVISALSRASTEIEFHEILKRFGIIWK